MSPRFSACTAWTTVAKRRSTISMGRPRTLAKYCRLPVNTVSSAPVDCSTIGPLGGGESVFDSGSFSSGTCSRGCGRTWARFNWASTRYSPAADTELTKSAHWDEYCLLPGVAIANSSRATSAPASRALPLAQRVSGRNWIDSLWVIGSLANSPTGHTYLPPSALEPANSASVR